jgi:D-3-phosphoglycerate dehydrogenase
MALGFLARRSRGVRRIAPPLTSGRLPTLAENIPTLVAAFGHHQRGTMKALLLENIHPEGVRLFTERGIEVEIAKGALDEAELIDALGGVQLLGIRSKTNVTKNVLDAAPDLEAIGAFCIGTNQIDLAAAASRGIPVFNAPFSNTRSVVELVIAEIVALARHLTDKNAKMHAGIWEKSAKGAHEVRGRTLGIVGYGNIGSQL